MNDIGSVGGPPAPKGANNLGNRNLSTEKTTGPEGGHASKKTESVWLRDIRQMFFSIRKRLPSITGILNFIRNMKMRDRNVSQGTSTPTGTPETSTGAPNANERPSTHAKNSDPNSADASNVTRSTPETSTGASNANEMPSTHEKNLDPNSADASNVTRSKLDSYSFEEKIKFLEEKVTNLAADLEHYLSFENKNRPTRYLDALEELFKNIPKKVDFIEGTSLPSDSTFTWKAFKLKQDLIRQFPKEKRA